jgi:polysaccharide biosynthesis transport protein
MDLSTFVASVRRNKIWALLVFVLCVGAAIAAVETATPQYTSSVQLFVAAQDSGVGNGLQGVYEGGLFTQQRVQSYVDIVSNRSVTAPVIAALRLPYTPAQLATRLSASVPANTVLINVLATDPSPARAQAIANGVATQFITFAATLEAVKGAPSPVKVSVSQPATLPTSPTSPRKALDIGLGVLLGLLLAAAFCAVRAALDSSIRTADRFSHVLGHPVLASIPFDKTAKKTDGLSGGETGVRREAYRQLRTNLQFLNVDNPPKTLVITSPQAGDGKTSTVLNLARVCADAKMRVAVIEADLRRPRIAELLGLRPTGGLTDALREPERLLEWMQPSGPDGPFGVLVSGEIPPNPSELLGSERMREILTAISQDHDIVLLDAPPLLPVTDGAVLAAVCDGVLLVARYSTSRVPGVRRALDNLDRVSATVLGGVLNGTPLSGPDGYEAYYSYTVERLPHALRDSTV